MNTAQFALNKELLEAAEMCDLGKVEELLKQDARKNTFWGSCSVPP